MLKYLVLFKLSSKLNIFFRHRISFTVRSLICYKLNQRPDTAMH
jgi:hypothetical protein